jgi:hypothetical protein
MLAQTFAVAAWLALSPIPVTVPQGSAEPSVALPERQYRLDILKTGLAVLGFIGTIATIGIAAQQYRKANRWKSAEFVAQEMKAFLGDRQVRNALTMLDWGAREIALRGDDDTPTPSRTWVTRELQTRALLPHVLRGASGSDVQETQSAGSTLGGFTDDEVLIRDAYDALLDGLERFDSYRQARLVTVEQLRPYLGYWIDDLSTETGDAPDCAWECVLLTYVDFYHFHGVQALFEAFGTPVTPRSHLYAALCAGSQDPSLCTALRTALADARHTAACRRLSGDDETIAS